MSTSNIKLLEDFTSYCSLRNKVISNNIANVGTEGYRREDVKFADILYENIGNLKKTDPRHFNISVTDESSKVELDKNKEIASGFNNVNIDEEMAELAKNTIQFKFASQRIAYNFKMLQEVIKSGG